MRTKIYVWTVMTLALMACGESAKETARRMAEERQRVFEVDSMSFKIAVMPTLDCLPFFVAVDCGLIDTVQTDVRLITYTSQMDCDTAIANNRVQMAVSDVVRVERMKSQGVAIDYFTSTNAHWNLMANHRGSVTSPARLRDKMLAMTRYSATDMLSDIVLDSVGLNGDLVYKVQINDVNIRLQMLRNNEMDALWTTEPYTTLARMDSNMVMVSSKDKGLTLGVVAMHCDIATDTMRRAQMEVVRNAYNAACDTINNRGIGYVADVVAKYCRVRRSVVDSLEAETKSFTHVAPPSETIITAVSKWLAENDTWKEPDNNVAQPAAQDSITDTNAM